VEPAALQIAPLQIGLFKIGAVASRSGLSVKTIRFYCEEGLIHPRGRSAGGYRLFGPEVLAELQLIRTLKALEIPLPEIAQLLDARRSGVCTCASLQRTIAAKAGEIDQKLEALRSLQAELRELLARWQDCGGRKPDSPPGG
jgi:MerR family copper efflux transcriptional regulator